MSVGSHAEDVKSRNATANVRPTVSVREITFNNGERVTLKRDDIVAFVGPNNVGKSRSLKDIMENIVNDSPKGIVISSAQCSHKNLTNKNILDHLEKNYKSDNVDNGQEYQVIIPPENRFSFYRNQLEQPNYSSDMRQYYKCFMTYLSTENRLSMTRPVQYGIGPYDQQGQNVMRHLDENGEALVALNDAIEEIFDIDVEIYNASNRTGYKFAQAKKMKEVLYGNYRDVKERIRTLEELSSQGDGIRSAVATLGAMVANDSSILLIDEPETFLHPPQARSLGRNMAKLSKEKQCLVSTHSLDLIKGLLEEDSSRVKIIKIDREGDKNTIHLVNNEDIKAIANDRFLKHTNILDGLFYPIVALCEDESDCRFFSMILEAMDQKKHQDVLFCSVHGKFAFKNVASLLKKLGVEYRILADFDLISEKSTIIDLFKALGIDYDAIKEAHKNLLDSYLTNTSPAPRTQGDVRSQILGILNDDDQPLTKEQSGQIRELVKCPNALGVLKDKGISSVPKEHLLEYEQIERALTENNIFIVETGEIESLVSFENEKPHGDKWVNKVFSEYPDFSDDSIYGKAKNFIAKVFNLSQST